MSRSLESRLEALEAAVVKGLTDEERVEALTAFLERGWLTYEDGVWGSSGRGWCNRLVEVLNNAEGRRREGASDG